MLHTPERLPSETLEQYRSRRAASKRAHDAITKPPRQASSMSPLDVSRFWLGQHTNPLKNATRNARKLHVSARQQRKLIKAERRANAKHWRDSMTHVERVAARVDHLYPVAAA